MNAKKNVKSKGSGTRKAGDVGEFMREFDHLGLILQAHAKERK
jgi:hypothetical protein